jgi:hypothetical protein
MYHSTKIATLNIFIKVFNIALCALLVTSLTFYSLTVFAQTTDVVTATVTATNLSVSVSDGSIAFGSVALNTATSTHGTAQTQTVSNDGSNAVLNVMSTDATNGTTWTLGTSAGSDIFTLGVSTTTGSSYLLLQDNNVYLTASSSFASLTSGALDFRFRTPTVSTDFVQKSLTITVQVTTP